MPGVKQASKRKRVAKAVPALGAAGLTFSLVGGASASAVPTANVQHPVEVKTPAQAKPAPATPAPAPANPAPAKPKAPIDPGNPQ